MRARRLKVLAQEYIEHEFEALLRIQPGFLRQLRRLRIGVPDLSQAVLEELNVLVAREPVRGAHLERGDVADEFFVYDVLTKRLALLRAEGHLERVLVEQIVVVLLEWVRLLVLRARLLEIVLVAHGLDLLVLEASAGKRLPGAGAQFGLWLRRVTLVVLQTESLEVRETRANTTLTLLSCWALLNWHLYLLLPLLFFESFCAQ